ncbi:serine/threonine phosphatase stp [Bacteroidia bacterium]|nr:serine/threonine phosphatase stp [Bacteroidia bacterium]
MLLKTDLNCNIGSVRQNNEDMILLAGELFRDKAQKMDFEPAENARMAAIVADGMGGHNGGEFASEMATLLFDDFIKELPAGLNEAEIASQLSQWCENTHRVIVNKSNESEEYEGMGTTFCGLLFYEKMTFALNIGDSRLYRFRNGILKQISTDHSMRQLTGDNSLPSNQIYNSLGAGDSAFIDVKDLSEQLFNDDLFLVCSDGLCDMISDEEIEQILANEPSADKLVEAAKQAGGKDNVSVLLLKIKEI